MQTWIAEWGSLLVRWIHVIAAIAWIGHAFFFHSIHHHLHQQGSSSMWMIHGGGFYFLEKSGTLPKDQVDHLLWFKWEAAFTWLSGFLLLLIVFYAGGGVYLVPQGGSAAVSMAAGLGSLAVGWLLYDLVWASPLGRRPRLATGLCVAALVGTVFALSELLSPRAAYLHTGALLATIMAGNVWVRIIPGQRRMLGQLVEGRIDEDFAARTAARSMHNGYMQFPVVFTMISNHYPSLYGHAQAPWLLLMIIALGAAGRQIVFDLGRARPTVYAVAGVSLLGLLGLTAPRPEPEVVVAEASGGRPIDPASAGDIRGVVRFEGEVPEREELELVGCPQDGPVYDDRVLVRDGKLQNAFVWVVDGLEGWAVPPAPDDEVIVDQVGCLYSPRIVGARPGQPVTFLNSDPVPHNVRSVSSINAIWNEIMPNRDDRLTKRFGSPEVMVKTVCDVHPWMSAYVGVVDHPFFAVTGADGAFALEGLPPGTYTVEAWHEVYGTQRQQVEVAPSGQAQLELVFR